MQCPMELSSGHFQSKCDAQHHQTVCKEFLKIKFEKKNWNSLALSWKKNLFSNLFHSYNCQVI